MNDSPAQNLTGKKHAGREGSFQTELSQHDVCTAEYPFQAMRPYCVSAYNTHICIICHKCHHKFFHKYARYNEHAK